MENQNTPKRCRKKAPAMMIEQRKKVVQKNEVAVKFSGKNLTTVGGMGLVHKFANCLQVEETLAKHVKFARRASKYTPARLLLFLVYAFVLDLTRLADTLLGNVPLVVKT
jgi:hypothetical protein